MEIQEYLKEQIKWSLTTFGPGNRDVGILDHVRKELKEIEEAPGDIEEWIDVIILALDAAWRNGYTPEEVEHMLIYKQEKNKKRKWPDWKTAEPGKAIEHEKPRPEYSDPKRLDEILPNQLPEFLSVRSLEFRRRFKAKLMKLGWMKSEADMEYEACLEDMPNELLDPEIEAEKCVQAYEANT